MSLESTLSLLLNTLQVGFGFMYMIQAHPTNVVWSAAVVKITTMYNLQKPLCNSIYIIW